MHVYVDVHVYCMYMIQSMYVDNMERLRWPGLHGVLIRVIYIEDWAMDDSTDASIARANVALAGRFVTVGKHGNQRFVAFEVCR